MAKRSPRVRWDPVYLDSKRVESFEHSERPFWDVVRINRRITKLEVNADGALSTAESATQAF